MMDTRGTRPTSQERIQPTMQAIQILTTGGPEVLTLRELPTPAPGPGEALIRIEASGVNFIDVYFREGRYPAHLPYILGQEAAGIIVALGEPAAKDAPIFKVGDRVAWCGIPGTYAQLAVAPVARLVHIPDAVTSQQAAAALLQGMTAHYLAHSTYPIRHGDEVLIHAGAGGTGLLLIQIAKSLGARVFTTVSNDEKAELTRAAGADEVIFYTREDFAAKIKSLATPPGLHAVYDSVGKTTFEKSLEVLRPRGMMVLFGGSSGPVPPFDLIRLSTMGSLYVTRPTLKDYIATRAELERRANEVLQSVADGSLKLRIEHVYPLTEADHAHRDLEARKTTGKLLLIP
jgi:NADPH2:quinone reductase